MIQIFVKSRKKLKPSILFGGLFYVLSINRKSKDKISLEVEKMLCRCVILICCSSDVRHVYEPSFSIKGEKERLSEMNFNARVNS